MAKNKDNQAKKKVKTKANNMANMEVAEEITPKKKIKSNKK